MDPNRKARQAMSNGTQSMRTLLLVVTLALLVGACGQDNSSVGSAVTTTTAPPPRDVTVALQHHFEPQDNSGIGLDTDKPGGRCGTSGFTDSTDSLAFMRPGSEVLLRNDSNQIVAEATLQVGSTSNITNTSSGGREFDCTWTVTFTGVPPTPFYQVEIAGNTLGTLSSDDLTSSPITVPLRL